MTESKLTEGDVARLLRDPSGSVRAETAARLAREFDAGDFTESERQLAEDIFRLMIRDAEVRVREALSANLKQNPLVPHDIALRLASDEDAVALPMLQFSDVLTSADLLDIVRSQGNARQLAVAQRAHVDTAVADALVDLGSEDVVAALVGNDQEVVNDFLHDFRCSATQIEAELKAAYEAGKTAQVGALAHKLKSSARAVGALALGELCAKIEHAGKAGRIEELTMLLPRFEAEMTAVNEYLDAL